VDVESFRQANIWTRRPRRGRLAVVILNASLDPAEELDLRLRTSRPSVSVSDMECREMHVQTARAESTPYRRVILDGIPAWQMRLVLA
jgi:hypothetical protein